MRIRTIKPEFWRSKDVARLSLNARLLFIGLWSYVDDNGVGWDELASIAGDLYADDLVYGDTRATLAMVSRGLQQLSEAHLIVRYTVDDPASDYNGRHLLQVTGWGKHQKIDKPSLGHRYPEFSGETADLSAPELPVFDSSSRDPRETLAPGTGEQGNRGTGEQRTTGRSAHADTPVRPEVEALCDHLADRIEQNGSKRPRITKGWRDAARLLLDRDDRDLDQAHLLIDWCQGDEFWRSNVLSMPTFREQYDRLRLAAQRKNHPSSKLDSQGEILARERALAAAYDAEASGHAARGLTVVEGQLA